MKSSKRIDRESFLSIAKASGLDTEKSHLEELYMYVQESLPNLDTDKMDLTGLEPFVFPRTFEE